MRTFNLFLFRVLNPTTLATSKTIGQFLSNHIYLAWRRFRAIFSAWNLKDLPLDETPDNPSAPSESQAPIVGQSFGSTESGDVNHALDMTLNLSPPCHPEPLSDAPILDSQIEEQLASPSVVKGDESPYHGDHESVVRSKIQTVSQTKING